MHRVTRPGPITKDPAELMAEIFKLAVLSSVEARSEGVKVLCLVGEGWNDIAGATSDLWTKVTLAFPLNPDQLSAVRKWLKASKPKVIDVEMDCCDPIFYDSRSGVSHLLVGAVFRGSEHPIHEFLGA